MQIELDEVTAARLNRICKQEYRAPTNQIAYMLDQLYDESGNQVLLKPPEKKPAKRTKKRGSQTEKTHAPAVGTRRFKVLTVCYDLYTMTGNNGNWFTRDVIVNRLNKHHSEDGLWAADNVSSNLSQLRAIGMLEANEQSRPFTYTLTTAGMAAITEAKASEL